MLMRRERAQVLVVDLQERLLPALDGGEAALARAEIVVRAARAFGVPVGACAHYPRGLGPLAASMREALGPGAPVFEKIGFSAFADAGVAAWCAANRARGRDQVVLVGAEAHVCVLQTALDLLAHGYAVFVVADAVASRAPANLHAATARLLHAGAHRVTSEMAAFEWAERGDDPAFKEALRLVK
ncbi:isochorismatase family protein [Salinarimonas ramus]|uniref:Hydrolase n=1 Tax=Salinarimonas ramus TaxID=690164 RepID=A0A917QCW1_9HYPH|nr:isochorismatase family protein [Salinarimonas ramus]GGK44160.1 hydrolase [Salinarimonas ramus]